MSEPAIQSPSQTPPVGVPKHLLRSRLVVGLSGPIAILIVAGLGLIICMSFNIGYRAEMLAAILVSLFAGFVAVLPLLVMMNKGIIAIVRLTMVAALLRVALMLAGLFLAMGPGWKLNLMPLVFWAMGCYFAMLIAESAATAWVTKHG